MTTSTKSLRVWPPDAARVDLVLAWDRVAMEPAEHGWWTSPAPVPAGSDYRFSVDGGDPLPDPRSPWQPAGVQGASRVLDHDTFAWTDSGWQAPPLASGVIYELHVSTFTPQGSYEGAITWLDHHEDPDLARAVSEGRRREFAAFGGQPEDVPDPQAPETFLGSRLDWTEIAREPHASLFAWHRDLIALRRRGDAVGTGDSVVVLDRVRSQ